MIAEVVNELVDRFSGLGRFDAVGDFARPIPQRVLFEQVMGLPAADVERCGRYVEAFFGDDIQERLRGTQELGAYAVELIQRNRALAAEPHLVSEIAHARIDGVEPSVIDASSVIMTLIIGTLDTPERTIASCLLHLATHPEHWRLLADDLDRLPRAVEEYLRLYTPAASAMRHARGDRTLGGVSIPDGAVVALGYAAGSRDPDVFESPGEFRIDRKTNRHLGFGVGPHYCPGAHLARAMIRNALEVVLTRLADPGWRLGTTYISRSPAPGVSDVSTCLPRRLGIPDKVNSEEKMSGTTATQADRLALQEDRVAIRELTARYCRAIDDNDAQGFCDVFTADGVLDMVGIEPAVRGHEQLRVFVGQLGYGCVHMSMDAIVDIDGERARQQASVLVLKRERARQKVHLVTSARYDDELVRTDEGWRFVSRTVNSDLDFTVVLGIMTGAITL